MQHRPPTSFVARHVAPAGLLVTALALIACDGADDGRDPSAGLDPDGDGKYDDEGLESGTICEQFEAVFDRNDCGGVECGGTWDWRSEDARIGSDCSLWRPDGTYIAQVHHRGLTMLMDRVGLAGESGEEGLRRKCAVLEQARQLCAFGSFTPTMDGETTWPDATELRQTRTASCHPGAEHECDPLEPDYDAIRAASHTPLSASSPVWAEPTYCTGQVVGEHGYATTVPSDTAFGTVTSWQCSPEESERAFLDQRLAEHGGLVLGYDAAALMNLECPVRKALVDCVAPNLGDGQACSVLSGNGSVAGVTYPGISADYCLSIVLGRDAGPEDCTTAHCDGRAIDLNNNVEGYRNSGNITGCIGTDDPGCTNVFRQARIDLPPQFVAVMEGCGFQWLGRADNAEGGHLGCDPMHFELILPGQ